MTFTTGPYDQQKRKVEYCVTTQLLDKGDEFSYFQSNHHYYVEIFKVNVAHHYFFLLIVPCVQPSFNQFIKTAALYLAKSRAFNTQRRSVCYFPDEHELQPSRYKVTAI